MILNSTTHPCPVCGTELQVAREIGADGPVGSRWRSVYCFCCPQMNDGAEGDDLPRALFALNTIAESMYPDERERIRQEVETNQRAKDPCPE